MNELALFAGAGGGILGGKLLGWRTVCAVEINPFCARRLMQRQNEGHLPSFPIWDDVSTFDGRPWRGIIDVVSGGFPCQDISAAGKGTGITGQRSGLWKEMARIIGEVRPKYVFVENSPMLTIRGLGTVLGDLAKMGFNARWGVLGSVDAGLPSQRDRIWIVASTILRECHPRQHEQKSRKERLLEKWAPDTRKRRSYADGREIIIFPEHTPVDYGMADWMDELQAIGNGQVPAVVALAWKLLTNQYSGCKKPHR